MLQFNSNRKTLKIKTLNLETPFITATNRFELTHQTIGVLQILNNQPTTHRKPQTITG